MFAVFRSLIRPASETRNGRGADKPLVFMHITKTGSTPVRVALLMRWPNAPFRMLMRPDDLADAWRADPWSFAGFRLIWGHFGTEFIRRLQFPFISATIVRDPIERVLSTYLFWKEVDLSGLPPELAMQVMACRREPLEKLLRSPTPFVRAHFFDSQAKQLAARSAIEAGAIDFDYGGDLLQRARAAAAQLHFIGFQDSIAQGLDQLFALLAAGSPPPLAQREVNATARSPENLAVRADRDLRRLIERCNEVDMAVYAELAATRRPKVAAVPADR